MVFVLRVLDSPSEIVGFEEPENKHPYNKNSFVFFVIFLNFTILEVISVLNWENIYNRPGIIKDGC